MPFSRFLIVSVSLVTLVSFHAAAQTVAAPATIAAPAVVPAAPVSAGSRPVTHDEFSALLRETLMAQPEMLKDAVQKLREKQEVEAKQKTAEGLAKHKAELFTDTSSPSTGPADADVTFVEFFDYHCGYCKHMLPAVTQLLQEDKKVRFIFKEFPILSDDSVTASRAALAVNNIAKDKYFEYHTALMKHDGKFDEKTLLSIAKKLGINSDKLKTEMGKQEITAILDKDRAIAADLGITGTPSVIVGNTVMPGAVALEDLKKVANNTRNGKDALEGTSMAPPTPAAPGAAPAAGAPATN
jgi:protein-disulfide isomerase